MKILYLFTSVLLLLGLMACSGSVNPTDTGGDEAVSRELSVNQTLSDNISSTGEVDWYHYQAIEANRMLQVAVSSNTFRPDVDLLVSAYELDAAGNKVLIMGAHAPEDSQVPADLKMNIYIDRPKDIYVAVRDLMDDDSSSNPYYVSIEFASSAEGNDNFDQATALLVDNESSCQDDHIGYVGDVDVYTFNVTDDGIYAVEVDFTPFPGGTDVELSLDLYDGGGTQVQTLAKSQSEDYDLVSYLSAGQYFVLIDDYGRDDFDTSSPYHVCVKSRAADEKNENDVIANASSMDYDPITQTYSYEGSIAYWDDKDWYRLPIQDINTVGFKVLQVAFDDAVGNTSFNFQIHLEDAVSDALLSHDFNGGSSEYVTQIKGGQDEHYFLVEAAQEQDFTQTAPYTLSVQILDVDDPAETVIKANGTGNDTVNTADVLVPSSDPNDATGGKIGYRGDEDWYSLTINDTSQPQVLEVFLDTDSEASYVDYYLSLMRDTVIEKKFDTNGEDGGTELKASVLVPAMATPVTYLFKVCDYQGDDGDGTIPYFIRANVNAIPGSLPVDSSINPGSVIYYDEADELEDGSAETVRLEHNSILEKTYSANTDLLDFNVLNPANGITRTENGDTTTVTFPWIAGYIDFEGDQDWFKIDFGPLVKQGVDLDSEWYYDIQMEFHVDNPGSATEYVWKLYRDRNNNGSLVDFEDRSNGFFASAGDQNTTVQAIDMTTPTGNQEFWVGRRWEGGFYISISDFDYVASSSPDNDWGYDVPYYYRLTLTYHSGVSWP